jgi:hypothetical protein
MFPYKRLLSSALALLLALSAASSAVAQGGALKSRGRAHARRKPAARRAAVAEAQPAPQRVVESHTVQSSVESFTFREERNTPLKAYLSPVGQIIIEFQADDPVYKVHPADENFVTVDRLTNDSLLTDPVVLRPGTGFRVPEPETVVTRGGKTVVKPPKPLATVVTLQMYSGLLVPVIIYPVRSMEQNTNKLVLVYNREEVARARRAAGLAVNLNLLDAQRTQPAPQVASAAPPPAPSEQRAPNAAPAQLVSATLPAPTPAPAVRALPSPTPQAASLVPASYNAPETARPAVATPATPALATLAPGAAAAEPPPATAAAPLPDEKLVSMTSAELVSVFRGRGKLSKFSKSRHGLSVAVSQSRELDAQRRVVVVAVRNTLKEPVRLVAGQPDIAVEILDGKERIVDTRPLERLYLQTTLRDNLLNAGETGFYAIVYETPTLGTHEYLRARVAQIFAADAPVTADLVISAR